MEIVKLEINYMKSPLLRLVQRLVFISPFLYPAYFLRFTVAGIPFTVTEIFIYVLFVLWVVELIRDRKIIIWDKRTRHYWYAVFLLFIGATLGVLYAPDFLQLPSGEILNAKRATLGIWKGWVVAPMLYFAVLTQVLKSQKDVEKILRLFVYSAVLVSVMAYGLGLFSEGVTIDFRLRGFYESANYLALYLVPAVLINIYFVLKRQSPPASQDVINISTLVILVYSLFFTQSYAGIIGVFGALGLFVLYLAIKVPKFRKKAIGAILLLMAIFITIILTQLNAPKFKQFLDCKNRSSTSVRLEIYQTSWDLVKKHPVIGHGPGLFQANYQIQAPETLERAPLEWNMPHPHNIFLGFWMNAGLLGLIAFLALLIFVHRPFTYPLIALWGTVIHGLFDMPFWKNDLAMIFWLLIAAILILQKHETHPAKLPARKTVRRSALGAKKSAIRKKRKA